MSIVARKRTENPHGAALQISAAIARESGQQTEIKQTRAGWLVILANGRALLFHV